MKATGTLYVVSTPIGNLGDMTYRAVEVLKEVDVICAEDTRHVRTLLQRYGVRSRVVSYHEHNEAKTTPGLLERLTSGANLALVTDAGTPLVSDPGSRLVTAAVDAGIPVVPIPGPSSVLAALVGSGLPMDHFTFIGFLPRGGRDRDAAIARLSTLGHTSVLFEAPARVATTLRDLAARGMADRTTVVARELTKQHEEFRRGTVEELAAYYRANPPRGEVVVLLEGQGARSEEPHEDEVRKRVRALRSEGKTTKDVVASLIAEFGVPRNRAYRLAQEEDQ
ncbi:MAG TPA: 16S rRNA (cytidine(1402)-2'-O)-methyltransferase [Gemmatimonadaceae bacterium]|nr:16S rRNA (cytidine(1402)-2'-O)-methyltransferase [Gemmatimonadaceae bacterium]